MWFEPKERKGHIVPLRACHGRCPFKHGRQSVHLIGWQSGIEFRQSQRSRLTCNQSINFLNPYWCCNTGRGRSRCLRLDSLRRLFSTIQRLLEADFSAVEGIKNELSSVGPFSNLRVDGMPEDSMSFSISVHTNSEDVPTGMTHLIRSEE